jgi:hypothetical protein
MMTCIGRDFSSLFKLVQHKIVVFDEVYILFHFNNITDVYQWRIFMYLGRNIFSEIWSDTELLTFSRITLLLSHWVLETANAHKYVPPL